MTTEVSVSRRRLTMATAIQMLSRVFGAFLGVVVAASLARSLSRAEFGELSLAMTIITLAGSITDLGLNQIAVREMARQPSRRAHIAGALTVTQLAMSGLLAGVGLALAFALLHGSAARIMAVFVVATLPVGAAGALSIASQARLRPELYIVPTLVQNILWLGIVLVLGATGAGLPAYGEGLFAANVVQTAVTLVVSRYVTNVSFTGSIRLIRQLMRHAWPLGLAGMFVTAYYKIDGLLLFHLRGATAAAYYSASYRFIDVLQILPMTVSGVMLPLASNLRRDGLHERSRRIYEFSVVVLIAIALPVVVCGVILAPGIINLVYGPKYHRSIPLLQILLPAFIPICLGYLLTSQLILHGRLRAYIAITGIAALANIAANLAGLSQYGPPFAAWATLATELAVVLATGTVVRRGLNIRFPLLRSLWCAAALVPTACVVWLVRDEALIVGVVAAAVLYPVSLLGSRAISVSDLRAFITERDLTKA